MPVLAGLTKFLEDLPFNGRAFVRRKIAVFQRNNFLGQRFQVQKILLINPKRGNHVERCIATMKVTKFA